MKRFTLSILAIAMVAPLVFSLTGCSTRLGHFTVVSTKNYDHGVQYKNVGRFEGKDMALQLLFIPFGTPNYADAVDRVVEAGGGVFVGDAVLRYTFWTIGIVGQFGYKIEGDVYAPVSHSSILKEGEESFTLVETPAGLVMKSTKTGNSDMVQDISQWLVDNQ